MSQESRHTDQHTTYGRNFDVNNVAKAGESRPQLLFCHPITQATNEKSCVGGIKIYGGPNTSRLQKGPVTKRKHKQPSPDGCGAWTALAVVELAFFLAVAKLTRIGRLDKK